MLGINSGQLGGQIEAPRQETMVQQIHGRINSANTHLAELVMCMKKELNRLSGEIPENPNKTEGPKGQGCVSELQKILCRTQETEILLSLLAEEVNRLQQI